jgi:Bacterial archaeo-eukaryotic release factor family 10
MSRLAGNRQRRSQAGLGGKGPADPDSAGLMLISGEGVTLAEWHPRKVEELRKFELDLTESAEHELVGPSYGHPRGSGEKATAARTVSQRDLWERRMEEHRVRFARSAAAEAAQTAKSRGWDVVLVLGDPRRAGPACEELRRRGVAAVRSELVLDWLRPAALATRLTPEVERARAELQKR